MKLFAFLATCGSAVMAVLMATGTTLADPQIQFQITGDFASAGDDGDLVNDSFIARYTSGSTNGGMGVIGQGSFNIPRTELFSDPNITPSPFLYSDVKSFGYFGLLESYDSNQTLLDTQFVIAAQPSTIAGQAFTTVFSTYLAAHPSVTSLADFITVLQNGPDYPTPGANTDWIDFNNDISANTGNYSGLIQTTFQTGETLDLIAFDNGTGLGSDIGDIQVQADNIPEPAGLAVLLAVAS